MQLHETISSAIQSLKANALRSALTMLGIIIGITSVIIISSVGESIIQYVSNELASFGTNYFQINPGNNLISAITSGGKPLTTQDVKAIKDANLPNIDTLTAFSVTSRSVSANDQTVITSIYGMTPEAQDMLKPTMIYGDFLSTGDENGRVVVLGSEIAEKLFGPNSNPVGLSVKIDDLRFLVIGVSKSGGTLFGSFFNSAVNIPLDTLQNQITGKDEIVEIDVGVRDTKLINDTMSQVELVLRQHRKIADNEENDFVSQSFTGALATIQKVTNLLTLFITGISSISLIVGGVGVMNIMLVSVTERTKEIGLLKAIGAKRKDIMFEFLLEATLMTTFGGLLGVTLGVITTYAISLLFKIPFTVNLTWIFLSTLISGSVGLLFGLYPAKKAAKLHPIDALRFE